MKQAAWRPDFGPDQPHPTAGATAIGARPILIAYNVNLASNRLGVAKRIASSIRASSGGLANVKALGMQLDHGIVQVSMNLTNYKETSMMTVFDVIAREAAVDGVRVLESEIVGLVPRDALPKDPLRRLKLRAEDLDKVLERRLETKNEERKTNRPKSPRRAALFAFRYSLFVTPSSASASVLRGTIPKALIFL